MILWDGARVSLNALPTAGGPGPNGRFGGIRLSEKISAGPVLKSEGTTSTKCNAS